MAEGGLGSGGGEDSEANEDEDLRGRRTRRMRDVEMLVCL